MEWFVFAITMAIAGFLALAMLGGLLVGIPDAWRGWRDSREYWRGRRVDFGSWWAWAILLAIIGFFSWLSW